MELINTIVLFFRNLLGIVLFYNADVLKLQIKKWRSWQLNFVGLKLQQGLVFHHYKIVQYYMLAYMV